MKLIFRVAFMMIAATSVAHAESRGLPRWTCTAAGRSTHHAADQTRTATSYTLNDAKSQAMTACQQAHLLTCKITGCVLAGH